MVVTDEQITHTEDELPENLEDNFVPQNDRERALLKRINQLKPLAYEDELTHVFNKRAILGFLREEIDVVTRDPARRVSALLFDTDFFKKINDKYGHLVGDEVLKYIAQLLKNAVRPYDKVGRWGGEEFLAVLPDTDEHEAFIVAERIREQIATQPFETSSNGQRLSIPITNSIGIATFPTHISPDEYEMRPVSRTENEKRLTKLGDEVVDKSDKALYTSKHEGRNKTTGFQPSMMLNQHQTAPLSEEK